MTTYRSQGTRIGHEDWLESAERGAEMPQEYARHVHRLTWKMLERPEAG